MRKATPYRPLAIAFLVFVFALLPIASLAAVTGGIQGTVKNASGAPLAGADITILGVRLTAVTDKDGHYLFTGVQPGTYTLRAELVTYKPLESQVAVQQDTATNADFTLVKATIKTGASRVIVSPVRRTGTSTQYTVTERTEQIEKSNPDNIYQFTGLVWGVPGVELDGAGFVHLRGADENQAGFMVDGVSVMDPTTNQFATNTVSVGLRSFDLIMGGPDASYGGALGGFINEIVANGKDFATNGKLSGGTTEVGFGPDNGWNYSETRDEYGGITANGKLDYYLSTIMYKNEFPGSTSLSSLDSSFDGLAKVNYYADPSDTFTLFSGQGFEEYNAYQPYNPSETPFQTYHFDAGSVSSFDTGEFQQDHQVQHYYLNYLNYKHSFAPKSFLSERLYTLTMPTEFHEENTSGLYQRTDPSTIGNQIDYTNQISPSYQLRAGMLYLEQKTDYNIVASLGGAPMIPLSADNPFYYNSAEKIKPTQTAIYLTNELKAAGDKLTLDLGARASWQHYGLDDGLPSYTDQAVDPRLGIVYSPNKDLAIRSSYAVMSQFPDTAAVEFLPPGAVGDPITALPGVDPNSLQEFGQAGLTYAEEQSFILSSIDNPFNRLTTEHDNDFDLGVERAFHALGGAYDLTVTGYQRKYYDEIEQDAFTPYPTSFGSVGHGHAGGIEMQLEKRRVKNSDWNGFVSYTNQVVKATDGFFDTGYVPYYYEAFHGDPTLSQAQIDAGDSMEYPTSYDQRHTIQALANKKITRWLETTLLFDAGSGYPFQNTLGTFTAAADAQHAVYSTSGSNLFAQVPITMQNQTTLQPFNATPGMSGWHYKFSLNSEITVTPTTSFFLGIDNIFNDRTVLIYGTNPYSGPAFYLPPSPQYPQGRVYYGPRATQNPMFISFGVREKF